VPPRGRSCGEVDQDYRDIVVPTGVERFIQKAVCPDTWWLVAA
jgi:hypothetical protein